MSKGLIQKLQREKIRLAKLESIQRKAEDKRNTARKQEIQLKRDIKELKIKTSKNFARKLQRATRSPEAKEAVQRVKNQSKKAKKLFDKFRDFADKVG